MSFDVELLVTFHCSTFDGVAEVARHFLPIVKPVAEAQRCPEAVVFLDTFANRTGHADRGPKNGITSWTYGGNYTRPLVFAEVLAPFWEALLRHPVEGGPLPHSHIIIIYQLQDSERAEAIEIFLDRPKDWRLVDDEQSLLLIRERGALPFEW